MSAVTNKIYGSILCILTIIAFMISCTPILGVPRYFILVAVISVLFLMFQLQSKSVRANGIVILAIGFYVILILGYKFTGVSNSQWGNYMNQLFFFIPFFLMLLIVDGADKKQQKATFYILMIIALINIVDNIYLGILYPYLIDTRLSFEEEELATLNWGSSSFYVFSLFFFNVCYFVFLNTYEKKERVIMFVAICITMVYIIAFCGKGSVVLFMVLSLFFQYYAKKAKNTRSFITVLIAMVVFYFIIIGLFKDGIINLIIDHSPNERVASRLIGLVDEDNQYGNAYSLQRREELYLLSINTWLANIKSFLIGIGDQRGVGMAESLGIGQHSDFLDNLARYGLLGAIPMFYFLKKAFGFVLSLFDNKYKLQVLVIIGVFVLCGFTKNVFSPAQASLFILLPLSAVFVNKSA